MGPTRDGWRSAPNFPSHTPRRWGGVPPTPTGQAALAPNRRSGQPRLWTAKGPEGPVQSPFAMTLARRPPLCGASWWLG